MLIRGTRRIAAKLFGAVVAFAFLAIATTAQAEPPTIYKWVDENGIAHYTTNRDSIPSEIRDRVESRGGAASATAPGVAATGQPHREDLMRDAVRKRPPVAAAGGEPIAAPTAPPAEVREIAAPSAAPVDRALEQQVAVETETAAELEAAAAAEASAEVTPEIGAEEAATLVEVEEPVEVAPIEVAPVEDEPTVIASPTPISEDVRDETSAVSAPPPAPALVLEPELQAQVLELDQKIAGVQQEIAQREETLAVLISSSDEQRTMPLVDDPAFREISQVLPKLQADLQTLREQRNKIQPTAPTP